MFTFKPYNDCDISGWSRDKIDQDLKREFHFSVHCEGLEELNNKVFVWVDRNIIQFFRTNDEVSEAERGRVIAAISLTNSKDTGFDLLFFAEHIKRGSLIPTKIEKKTIAFLQRAETIFNDFPFFKDKNRKQRKEKEYNNPDRVFMRLCLLEFLLAVDTHDEIFAVYPGFDELRKKLRESKVYLLLCAKLRYCMYHYKGRNALNSEEYTFVVSKYADLLMDSDFNKIVPPEYFDEPRFLYNPEFELREIMKRKDSKILEPRVKQKITNFFLTKHAVVESSLGNSRFAILVRMLRLGLMLLIVLWAIWSFLHPDNHSGVVNYFYENWVWKIGVGICLFIAFLLEKKQSFFLPRILVALVIGWFTIAVSEDLIKSQLDLSERMVRIALIVVLAIVALMLHGEVRQHSPYYKIRWPGKVTNFPKTTSVLIYAMFWNLLLGIIMQQVTYSSLLKTSGAVPDVVLDQLPNDVAAYKKSIETCISMLDDYDRSMEGIIHDNGKTSFSSSVTVSSLDTSLSFNAYLRTGHAATKGPITIHDNYLLQIQQWLQMAEHNMGVTMLYHNDTCWMTKTEKNDTLRLAFHKDMADKEHCVMKVLDSVKTMSTETSHNPSWIKLCRFVDSCKLVTKDVDLKVCIERNLDTVREIKNDLRILLLDIDNFMASISNSDSLMNWTNSSKTPPKVFPTEDYYLAYLGYNAITKHCFTKYITMLPQIKTGKKVEENVNMEKGKIMVFPRMLIFHSLIVLIIAFVGQLIISDKSVTEPL